VGRVWSGCGRDADRGCADPVDAVTRGANILATPTEIGFGASLGAAAGYEFGGLLDVLNEQDLQTSTLGSNNATFPGQKEKTGNGEGSRQSEATSKN
jgi:hypothetical protein